MMKINKDNIFWTELLIITTPIFVFSALFYFVGFVNSVVTGAKSGYNETPYEVAVLNYETPVVKRSMFAEQYQNEHNPILKNWNVDEKDFNALSIIATHRDSGQILYSKELDAVRPIAEPY